MRSSKLRNLHVGHVVDCFATGGIATGVFELIRATQGLIEHTVISLVNDLRLLALLPARPAAHVIQPGPTRLLGFTTHLAWLICRNNIDILHCNNNFAWLDSSLAAALTGRVCMQTFHGVEMPLTSLPGHVRVKGRLAARLTTEVTAVSEASRHMVCTLGGLPKQAVEVIPNGVDLTRFRPQAPEAQGRGLLRQTLGLHERTPLVAHVAGLRPIKDQATLLRAWKRVLESAPRERAVPPVLLLAGEGECLPELQELSRQLGMEGGVRFLGQRRDLDQLLPLCDLFVLSSLSEGMSFAILEAMAAGLPVVATRVGGNSELVEEGGSGLLVPPQQPAMLAGAIHRLLQDPLERRRMALRGRQIAEQRYDQSRSLERYVQLYARLAPRRGVVAPRLMRP